MFDTHIHTEFSTDSKMSILQLKEKLQHEKMGGIITEHIDLDYPDKEKFRFNPEEYFKAYGEYRSEYLLLGVEFGLGDANAEENRSIANSFPFDYVIGSIHMVDGMDLFYQDYYRDKDKHEAYEKYLKAMARAVKKEDYFDSLGHIDYICRYAIYENKEIDYKEFWELIDQVLRAVVNTGRVMELNTRRLDSKGIAESLMPIYRRYYELGGRYATIGSDAHKQEAVGGGFKEALEVLKSCSLRLVFFKERKMEY